MKNFFLTILLIFMVSFSFSQQEKDLDAKYAKAKFHSVDLVNQLDALLKLNKEQKRVFQKEFSEYVHKTVTSEAKIMNSIKNKVKTKLNPINKKTDKLARQRLTQALMKHAEERDKKLLTRARLTKKQMKQYKEFMNTVDPIKLEAYKKK